MGWGAKPPNTSAADAVAKAQADLAREQWESYQKTFAPVLLDQMQQQVDIGKDTYELSREAQNFQLGLSKKYDDRFWQRQAPLEDQIVDEARDFDTPAERERLAGTARADVEQAFGGVRAQQRREMGRMGLNPSDPKYFAMNRELDSSQALATASAMNKTREAARQMGWAKRMDAAALGRGLPGFSGDSSRVAMGWGGQGMDAGGMGMRGATAALGGMNQTAQGAGANYAGAGNTYGTVLGVQQKAAGEKNSMLGSGIGAVATIGAAFI